MSRGTAGPLAWLVVAASLLPAPGCHADDRDMERSDGGAAHDGTARADAAPSPGCSYDRALVCWQCDSNVSGKRVVGCKKPLDCYVFCDADDLPSGFFKCWYVDPVDASPECKGLNFKRSVPFSSCKGYSSNDFIDKIYSCPGCFVKNDAYLGARSPDGKCYVFGGGCPPQGFTQDDSCRCKLARDGCGVKTSSADAGADR